MGTKILLILALLVCVNQLYISYVIFEIGNTYEIIVQFLMSFISLYFLWYFFKKNH